MAKKSKLTEKASRMPDLEALGKELAIHEYLESIPTINSEAAKSHRFTLLLNSLFGVQPGFIEDYVKGIETYLKAKGKDRIHRGRADQLSGSLIIEFEKDLTKAAKVDEAEGQLKRYTACAWSQEPPGGRNKYLCLATDGLQFRAYAPIAEDPSKQAVEPDEITLNLLEDFDAPKIVQRDGWEEFYFLLDRYLLRKTILHPTSDHIVKDFGPNSHAFQVVADALVRVWREVQDHSDYSVLYEAWDKYLRIVYGTSQADEELFVRHTYLATLAKLMVWSRLAGRHDRPNDGDLIDILEGTYFRDGLRIENFLEEDLFSWIARKETKQTAIETARLLLGLLGDYNLREISEDVLKALYEELVDPVTRHDLGEYYTPDWLAHRIVRRLLEPSPESTVLDPACGSGTFLYMAIREKRRLLGDSMKTLTHVLSGVVGLDIHPLACIIAKANYVLALGDLMTKRRRRVAIPVYLANSIRPPEREVRRQLWHKVECYRTSIDDRETHIPASLITDPDKYDLAIEAARDFAVHSKEKEVNAKAFGTFLKRQHPGLLDDEDEVGVLFSVAHALKKIIKARRDTIWVFVLKNIYRPLFLREQFDIIVGNPPWLSYRYVEQPDYRDFLKYQITKTYGLVVGRANLVTHLELGTLFLVRSADLYLKPEGKIGFVLPKSIFSADQHDALRRGKIKRVHLKTTELWDLEGISPLFKTTAAAVYIGEKKKGKVEGPIPGEIMAGELPFRNAGLDKAEDRLSCQSASFSLSEMGESSFWSPGKRLKLDGSVYRGRFRQGASIVPRCFWFVDVRSSDLGYDEALPPLASSAYARNSAKKPYKDCVIEGAVESKFVYATLLPADMVPFGILCLRPIVLPLLKRWNTFYLQDADKARREGYVHLAGWLDRAQAEWKKRRGEKAKNMTSLERLNYQRLLTGQDPKASYRALYCTSGTHVCACVVRKMDLRRSLRGGLEPQDFVADTKTYHLETDSAEEGQYLSAFLNAPAVDKIIKEAQSRGLWGARDIHKKVLDLPIPQFGGEVADHCRLAEIGKACAKKVRRWVASGGPGKTKSIGVLRQRVRQMLSKELAEIDSIVKPMLRL